MKDNFNYIINFFIGLAGFVMSQTSKLFEEIDGWITLVTSFLGAILLLVTVITGIVKYRKERLELKKLKKEVDEL